MYRKVAAKNYRKSTVDDSWVIYGVSPQTRIFLEESANHHNKTIGQYFNDEVCESLREQNKKSIGDVTPIEGDESDKESDEFELATLQAFMNQRSNVILTGIPTTYISQGTVAQRLIAFWRQLLKFLSLTKYKGNPTKQNTNTTQRPHGI